jgi:tetratricopeptide (TPR) repeat protein
MTESSNPVQVSTSAAEKSDPVAAFKQAELFEAAGRDPEAEQLYRSLLRAFPTHSAVLHNLALLVRRRGDLVEAEALMRRAVNNSPQEAFFYSSLGAVLRSAGKVSEAESAFREAIRLRPEFPDVHYNLGLLLEANGAGDDALAAHREATRLKPDFAEALTRVAALLNDRGLLDQALESAESALHSEPDFFDAHYYHGWILSRLSRYDEALDALARALTLRPASFEAALATANALRDAGRSEQALAAYWQVLERRPGRVATHIELNHLAWTSGRADLHLRSFGHAREKMGDDFDLMVVEGAIRNRTEDYAGAEQILRRAVQLAPSRAIGVGLLARAVAGQRRFDESYPIFAAAISADPGDAGHRRELGLTLLRAGRPAEALRVLQQALAAYPQDTLLLAGISAAFRELGDPRYERLVEFKKYVKIYDIPAPEGYRDVAEFNAVLAVELDRLHTSRREPIDQSLSGGTQTTGRLFDLQSPAIVQIRAQIEAVVANYIYTLPDEPDHPMLQRRAHAFAFAGAWSCKLRSGGKHNNHVHHEGWISSAYYVRLPEASCDDDSRDGWLTLGQTNLGLGQADVPEMFVKPIVGRLVLFPSFYWHGTVPFASDSDRMTIAFDVVPA